MKTILGNVPTGGLSQSSIYPQNSFEHNFWQVYWYNQNAYLLNKYIEKLMLWVLFVGFKYRTTVDNLQI